MLRADAVCLALLFYVMMEVESECGMAACTAVAAVCRAVESVKRDVLQDVDF